MFREPSEMDGLTVGFALGLGLFLVAVCGVLLLI